MFEIKVLYKVIIYVLIGGVFLALFQTWELSRCPIIVSQQKIDAQKVLTFKVENKTQQELKVDLSINESHGSAGEHDALPNAGWLHNVAMVTVDLKPREIRKVQEDLSAQDVSVGDNFVIRIKSFQESEK